MLVTSNQVPVPTEIMILVLEHLPSNDRKAARLVCRELSKLACSLLFKSIAVSPRQSDLRRFSQISETDDLCKMVRVVIWEDLPFRDRGSKPSQQPTVFDPQQACILHNCTFIPDDENAPDYLQRRVTDEAVSPPKVNDFNSRIKMLLEHPDCVLADLETCLVLLVAGFRSMTGLKTLILRNVRDQGSIMDVLLRSQTLSDGEYLPLSYSAMRLLVFPEHGLPSIDASDNAGLTLVLKALAISGAAIQALVTEGLGLLKPGFRFLSPDLRILGPLEYNLAKAFESLRKITICLQHPEPAAARSFASCLQEATQLEHLEISIMHGLAPDFVEECRVLPTLTCFTKLHTLVLESLTFEAETIVSFLIRHARSLTSVVLWHCRLCEPGTWEGVVEALSHAQYFHPDSILLKSPVDADIEGHLQGEESSPRVKSDDVLRYISDGGVNPFKGRRWVCCVHDLDDDISNASEYSDTSGWMGHCDTDEFGDIIDRDPDGPEYNSDYDFDAESELSSRSGSVPDQEEPAVTRVLSTEDRFYGELWSGFGYC